MAHHQSAVVDLVSDSLSLNVSHFAHPLWQHCFVMVVEYGHRLALGKRVNLISCYLIHF